MLILVTESEYKDHAQLVTQKILLNVPTNTNFDINSNFHKRQDTNSRYAALL